MSALLTIRDLAKGRWKRSSAFRWALRYEEEIKERPAAVWISQHGIQAFRGKQTFLSDADWQVARARIRNDFAVATRAGAGGLSLGAAGLRLRTTAMLLNLHGQVMAPTASAIAAMNISGHGFPRRIPATKISAASARMT